MLFVAYKPNSSCTPKILSRVQFFSVVKSCDLALLWCKTMIVVPLKVALLVTMFHTCTAWFGWSLCTAQNLKKIIKLNISPREPSNTGNGRFSNSFRHVFLYSIQEPNVGCQGWWTATSHSSTTHLTSKVLRNSFKNSKTSETPTKQAVVWKMTLYIGKLGIREKYHLYHYGKRFYLFVGCRDATITGYQWIFSHNQGDCLPPYLLNGG